VPEAVAFRDVTRRFATPDGRGYTAVAGVTLAVAGGEFVSIVGPTGCGKSTLLNLAAGLLAPDAGAIDVFGRPLSGINRHATYMFQQDVLLPWKSAEDNVILGPLFRGMERHYPHQLSGGMRKRVALAQNLILNPDILLMDEPFAALDVQTRQIMENDLLRLWAESRKTVLFVTHDLDEAIALADRVVVLSSGPASRVIGDYRVDLARPRDVAEVRLERAFTELYRTIWRHLQGEVRKAYASARMG
jgi:NitT/TauT family transport system ATP-binding protein